ncbi:MAG TPA: M20 family metallopeptidase [Acidimicrobiales bacterium]|nr:M20 family metallopeptidase [Acidimicrobiales bacterium]
MDVEAAKQRVIDEVDRRADVLIEASHQIHGKPELAFEERFAHDLLTDILESDGLDVERHAYGQETGFAARAGSDGPTIAVLCEYDALPGVGHACGHNVIGTAGLGAGLAAAALADELGGRLLVLGTPAEEGGGGKVLMADEGALDGVDAAMMVHPAGGDLISMNTIAVQQLHVTYVGEAAHAAAYPYRGRNALDAAVLGYVNVAALRQHIRPTERVHGIFTKAGDQPNIVPKEAAAHWYVRSPNLRTLEALKGRVFACLEAGAAAAGCEMEHHWQDPAYADMLDNPTMVDLYKANAERLGRSLLDPKDGPAVVGSTDMGNVSHLVPSIHPMIQVSPPNVSIHSPEFTKYAASEDGDRAVLDGAKAMAMTVADLWLQPGLLEAAKAEFAAARGD